MLTSPALPAESDAAGSKGQILANIGGINGYRYRVQPVERRISISLIIGSPPLTPSPSSCPAGSSITVNAESGSGLWALGNNVKGVLMKESFGIVLEEPITAYCPGDDTAVFNIPGGVELGNYFLTLYKESGGVYTLLGVASFSIT